MADNRTPEQVANDAFAKALDFVRAQQTPKDNGEVEAAVEVLRGLVGSQAFSQPYTEKVSAMRAAATQPQGGQPQEVTPNTSNPVPQGGIQPGNQQAAPATTGQANTPGV
jgi:hypothetical protein